MDRTGTDSNADIPRDAHLRRALRHAPDHELQAPPLLSAAILAAARRAADPARARRHGWRAWLAAPWAGAGAVAAVLLVSGVLWVQRDALPPAVAPSEAPSDADAGATATLRRAEPAPLAAAAPPAVPGIEQAAREARVGAAQPAPPSPTRAIPPAATKSLSTDIAHAAAPVPPLANRMSPAVAETTAALPPPTALGQEALAAAPSPAPLPAAEASTQRLRSWRPGLAGATAGAAATPAAVPAAPLSAAVAASRPPLPVLALAPMGTASAAAVPSPVSPEAATAWSPWAADAAPRPLPAGWLQRLAAATPTWEEAAGAHGPLAGARAITLWRQDEALIWLQLARDRVQWCSAATGCRVAAIDEAESAALSAALPP